MANNSDNEHSGFLGGLTSVVMAVSIIRAPLIAGLVSIVVFQVPQFVEVIDVFGEDRLTLWPQLLFFFLFLGLFCLLLFRLCHDLLNIAAFNMEQRRFRARLKRFIPIVVAILPVFGVLGGVTSAYKALTAVSAAPLGAAAEQHQATGKRFRYAEAEISSQAKDVATDLNATLTELRKPEAVLRYTRILLAFGIIALAGAAVYQGGFRTLDSPNEKPDTGGETSVVPASLRLKSVWFLAFVILIAIFAAQSLSHPLGQGVELTDASRLFGPIPIALLFLIFLAIFLSLLTRVYDRLGIPAISLLLAIGLTASYFDWNNNHSVKTVDREVKTVPPLALSFAQWLENRPGGLAEDGYVRNFIKAKGKFPIYLFAAEGGGQYAASFAGATLGKLIDRCPALGRHMFAISGVSGGGVGSGLFVSMMKAETEAALRQQATGAAKNPDILSARCDYALLGEEPGKAKTGVGPIQQKLFDFQNGDFLSPLLAETLFGDMVQRLVPVPIPLFDRARAFEAGLEATWHRQNPQSNSPLQADFLSHWTPKSNHPMLLLNTTRVQTGEPITIAPFLTRRPVVNGSEVRTIYSTPFSNDARQPNGRQSITLNSAMGLSARFPFVLPAGRLHADKSKSYFDLVDGGVFESSGADTLNSFLNQLDFYQKHPAIIGRVNDNTRSFYDAIKDKIEFKIVVLNESPLYSFDRQNLNELLSAPLALYRARSQRAAMAVNTLLNQNAETRIIRLSHDPFALPLGWQLSTSKQHLISRLVGQPDQCSPQTRNQSLKNWLLNTYVEDLQKAYGLEAAAPGPARDSIKAAVNAQAARIWNLFYLMNANRCILQDIIGDIRTE